MARRKKKRLSLNKRYCFLIITVVITLGLVLLIVNRTHPKELEYSIEFHEESAEIYIGDAKRFGYTIVNPKGNDNLKWTTTNSRVATVDETGNVVGMSFGDVVIIVELDNGSQSRLNLRVKSYPVYLRVNTNVEPTKSGWYNKKLDVTLDTLNVEDIKYCVSLNEECFENINYKDKITLKDGIWYLNIVGNDKNGKVVTYHEMFKIDLVSPKCNLTRVGKISEAAASAEVICEDDASGIEKYVWYRDNERIETTTEGQILLAQIYLKGKHKYSVKVYDIVGNVSTYEID